jgi:hypothetical protein
MPYRTVAGALVVAGSIFSAGIAHADVPTPQVAAACPADLAGTMTLLPDEQTYVVCQEETAARFAWTPAPIPFEPNDQWLSYGPVITLHGQGMRNPNLTSGRWTATPQDSETVCRVQQETVVEAGVLSAPQVSEGLAGEPVTVMLLPNLFYAELSGNCLWAKD